MAERSKIQTPRSKLPTRKGLDSEDKNIYDLQNDIDMQLNNIKIEVMDNEYLDEEELTVKSPLQFSIKVEVEEYSDQSNNFKLEDDRATVFFPVTEHTPCEEQNPPTDYAPERLGVVNSEINSEPKHNTLYLFEGDETDICLEADRIALNSSNIVDKILAREVRNLCGVLAKPNLETTPLHRQIYTVYKKWKSWCNSTKMYEQPLFYKCYICEKSWWYLGPFVEHAKEHALEVYTIYLETTRTFLCNIVLASNVSKSEKFIHTDGDCWRCNKPYSFHEKTTNLCYRCKGCQKDFFKCSTLWEHENICSKITHSMNSIDCKICKYVFESYNDLERHLLTSHTVRSDLFIWTSYKKCFICDRIHYNNNGKTCSKKNYKFVCELCSRRFASQLLVDSHKSCTQSDVQCAVCDTVLPKHCMQIKHYITHTDMFKLVCKCSKCTEVFLFWEQNSMIKHQCLWHKNKSKQECYFELILIPTKCIEKLKVVNPEPVPFFAAVYDDAANKETTVVNAYEDEPVTEYEIKHEVVDSEESDGDVNRYIIEDSNSTYDETTTNIFQSSGTSNSQIEAEIKTELMDSSGVDMANISRDSDDGEERRLVMDIGEHEEGKFVRKKRQKRGRGPLCYKRVPKIYSCRRCPYQGIHREYKDHVLTSCMTSRARKSMLQGESKLHKPHKCSRCKVTFISLNGYLYHFAKSHGYKEFSCPVCFEVGLKTKLSSHFNFHVKQMFLKVKALSADSSNKTTIIASNVRYECKECKKVVEDTNFFQHWESHYEVKNFDDIMEVDNVEHILNSSAPALNIKHLISKLLTLRSNYTCRTCMICDRHFSRVNDSKRHIIEHLLSDAYKNKSGYGCLRCQICQEMFEKSDAYKKHLREHASLPIYKCGLCDKSFSDSSNFVKHKKIHNIQVLVCDICKNKYQAKSSLEKHMEIHNTTKPITCKLCCKIFYSEASFKKHRRAVHERHRAKYKCLICENKYTTLKGKWDHMWLVHKERKFKADCPICQKAYRKFQDVKRHVRTEHGSIEVKNVMRLSNQRNGHIKDFFKHGCGLKLGAKETLIIYD